MFRWTPFPLVRITIAFCAGILLAIYNPGLDVKSTAILISAFAWLILFGLKRLSNWLKYLFSLLSVLLIVASGFLLVKVRTQSNWRDHILHVKDSIEAYEAVIVDHFDEKKNSFKTTVEVLKIKTLHGWHSATGKVNFYIYKNNFKNQLVWGDHIVITGSPYVTSPPQNPHEFNYKRFLTFKNIYHQDYVRSHEWTKTGIYDKSLLRYSALARNYFTSIIKSHIQEAQEQAVCLALVIGVTDGIDNELISAYSASGAMHVLAVSGLHVGIIYLMLTYLLSPLKKRKHGQWIISIVGLTVLWSYAFVTGLSPSVMRAVMMFSFVALAKPLNRRSSIYNTLAGSAFILLLFDPYLIMSVGFQLSYLAVIGIIWIQRPLYQLYEPNNLIVDWIWKITCVSISAQATTFALGLFYFHQFPTYFLFSNLMVIPISTGILISGILLLVFSLINPIAGLIGWLLKWMCWILNYIVFQIESLPFSTVSNVYINVLQSWLILSALVCFVFLFQFKRLYWLYFLTILVTVLSAVSWLHYRDRTNQSLAIVYHVNGSTVFEIIDQSRSYFLADSSLLANKDQIRFHINGNRLHNLVDHIESFPVKIKSDSFKKITYKDKSFLFLDHKVNDLENLPTSDFIIVGRKSIAIVPSLIKKFAQSKIILDGTCSEFQVKKLKSKLPDPDAIFAVTEQGAFQVSL